MGGARERTAAGVLRSVRDVGMVVGGDSFSPAHDAAIHLLRSGGEEDICFLFRQPFHASEVLTPAQVLPERSLCARNNSQAPECRAMYPIPGDNSHGP